MTVMSISEFKAKVTDLIERAEAGEVIEITKNRRTIAELRPKRGATDAEFNASRKRMIDIMRKGFDLGGGPITEEDKYGDAVL